MIRNNPEALREPRSGRSRFSIVYKLSLKLFLRLLSIFISLDIAVLLIATGAMIIYSEKRAATAAEKVMSTGLPTEAEGQWLSVSGLEIKAVDKVYSGHDFLEVFMRYLPEITAYGTRRFSHIEPDSTPAINRLDGLVYIVGLDHYGTPYEITIMLGAFVHYFRLAFSVLLALELLTLISRAFKDTRLVRRTLKPISELTEAAQTLNKAGASLDIRNMEALAGKLEGINASKLDTRIQINETQDELKSLAKAINSMLDRINESYRAQVRFVSDASHELRTPISVIQGYANLLDRWGKRDEKTLQESINAIKEETANMKELVEQLLFLARGDNNTIALQIEEIRLKDLVGEVVSETQMIDSAHEYEAKLTDASIFVDKGLIKQALRILVDNSIKYTEPGGHIVISAGFDGDFARLAVQDDGIGIEPEAVPNIFDRFYRTDESRARATGGAGLGLSIAKWIAARHGGHMEVLSREGIGTRISILLPVTGTGIAKV